MDRKSPRSDARRISQVLAGVGYPAPKWQLIMQAEEYGADVATRADLWALPSRTYPDLPSVLAAVHNSDAPAADGTHPRLQPVPQVAGRLRPLR